MPLVKIEDLTKSYGRQRAVDGITLTIPRGVIVGLLGPNGSGKSTLLKLITGLVRPSSGRIWINQSLPSPRTKAQIAYLPEVDYLYGWMTVGQTLDFVSRFYQDWNHGKARNLLTFMELQEEVTVKSLSKGMRARLKIVLALARDAELVLLDEPLSGIDPPSRTRIVEAIIFQYRVGAQTLVLSTHEILETEGIFDEVVFLHQGKVALQGNADSLRSQRGKSLRALFEEVCR